MGHLYHHRHHSGRVFWASVVNFFKLLILATVWWPVMAYVTIIGYAYIGVLALVRHFWPRRAWTEETPAEMTRKFGGWLRKAWMPFGFTPAYRPTGGHATHVTVKVNA